ncbi:GolD/DthD family dehydrogenase [Rothia halotolerans]|uniref:GolD/DthD family dehydrogenase n=1 Tax=Rothia halotolerans TaxID=405770 RepID=UPI00101E15EE|nr:D-threitol dehydrogenase [Rothia halotolerans]
MNQQQPSTEFSGRNVLITGAASGIGLAIAEHLAARGARVAGVDVAASIEEAVAGLPGEGHLALRRDLTEPGAADEIVEEVRRELGEPHVLVNSAGVAILGPAEELPAADWRRTMDINLDASFFMAQAAGRAMTRAGWGRIVNLASQASVIGLDQHVAYCASKAAIVGMTKAMSLEWAPRGVTVNAVSPTVVETPLGKKAWAGEKGERARAGIPAGRFAQPEEVAAMVAYLASDDAAMVTGSNMLLDGGFTSV